MRKLGDFSPISKKKNVDGAILAVSNDSAQKDAYIPHLPKNKAGM
jgi:hypothetical protein